MKRSIAIGTAAGAALVLGLAAPALAVYPPDPGSNSSSSGTTTPGGGSISFEFGTLVPFTPGTTVTVTSQCTAPNGTVFNGPSTTTTANGAGKANVSLVFTQPGVCVVTATGAGNVPGGIVTATSTITVTGSGGGGGGGGGGTPSGGGALPKTGADNTLIIAAVGGGLLLAGVGAVVVARRREHTSN